MTDAPASAAATAALRPAEPQPMTMMSATRGSAAFAMFTCMTLLATPAAASPAPAFNIERRLIFITVSS